MTDDTVGRPALVTTFANAIESSSPGSVPDRTVGLGANVATASAPGGRPFLVIGLYRKDNADNVTLTHVMTPDEAEFLGDALVKAAKRARKRGAR